MRAPFTRGRCCQRRLSFLAFARRAPLMAPIGFANIVAMFPCRDLSIHTGRGGMMTRSPFLDNIVMNALWGLCTILLTV